MTGDDDPSGVEPAWHERTSTVAGASVAALIVIAILFWGVSCVSREFNAPDPTPQYYLDPSTSGSASFTTSSSSGTSTTETITSTSPPVTTDIDPGDTSGTSTTSGTSGTSGSDTTTSFNPSNLPRTRTPSTYDDGRTRPRLNETRTLYPHQ